MLCSFPYVRAYEIGMHYNSSFSNNKTTSTLTQTNAILNIDHVQVHTAITKIGKKMREKK